jgi:hypothetical protein
MVAFVTEVPIRNVCFTAAYGSKPEVGATFAKQHFLPKAVVHLKG